jgi:hypothetical protein
MALYLISLAQGQLYLTFLYVYWWKTGKTVLYQDGDFVSFVYLIMLFQPELSYENGQYCHK